MHPPSPEPRGLPQTTTSTKSRAQTLEEKLDQQPPCLTKPMSVIPQEDQPRPTPPPRLKRRSKTVPSIRVVPLSPKTAPLSSLSESSSEAAPTTTTRAAMRHAKSLDNPPPTSGSSKRSQEVSFLTSLEKSSETCKQSSDAVGSESLAKFVVGGLSENHVSNSTSAGDSEMLNSTSTLLETTSTLIDSTPTLLDAANSDVSSSKGGGDSTDELFSLSQESSSDSSFKYLHQIVGQTTTQAPPPPRHRDRSHTHSSPTMEMADGMEERTEDDVSSGSMAVNASSTCSSSLQRPHSVMSPFDAQSNFVFQDGERLSGGAFTIPRNGVVTWSPRSQMSARSKGPQRGRSPLPASTRYTLVVAFPLPSIHSLRKLQPSVLKEQGVKLSEGLLVLSRNFHSMKLHIHPHSTYDADGIKELMERKFLADKPIYRTFAFEYRAAIRHANPTFLHNRSLPNFFQLTDEMRRLGLLNSKLWAVTRVLLEYGEQLCPSYPPRVLVPRHTPDTDLMRAALVYREGRFPTLSWLDRSTGAALLRAASTKDDRGQAGVSRQVDEALLHAICGCNKIAKGSVQLYIFTEKTVFTDAKGSSLTADQVRTYYYHNCSFVHAVEAPSFKSVRHSYNKLQAMLESRL